MTTTATTATTEPARPKLALKKRVVDVAALKASQPAAQPKPASQPQEKPLTRKEAHALRMKEQAEAAEKKRAEKAAKHAEFLAQQTRQRAEERVRNRVANEDAHKRATAHREAFEEAFSKLTMIGCNKPLALNSYAILLEYAHTKIGKDVAGVTVRRALQQHCDVGKYLNMLAASAGKPRYNPLNGEIVGEVTEAEAEHAKAVMDERRTARKAAKEAARQGRSVPTNPVQTGTDAT